MIFISGLFRPGDQPDFLQNSRPNERKLPSRPVIDFRSLPSPRQINQSLCPVQQTSGACSFFNFTKQACREKLHL